MECIEFPEGGSLYDNMGEEGAKFTGDFKWKTTPDGALMFPDELKKFTQRRVHRVETILNEKLDVVFAESPPGKGDGCIKVRLRQGSD